MAKKRSFGEDEDPAWMVTFSDLMTLLLTFFIILVSMAVVDEENRIKVIESVQSVLGIPETSYVTPDPADAKESSSSAISSRPEDDAQEKRQLLFEDNQDIILRPSGEEVNIEIPEESLFAAGQATLTDKAHQALDRLLPILMQAKNPIIISGHSAPSYSEGFKSYLSTDRSRDGSWALALDRSLAVYRHLLARGVDQNLLRIESYGSHKAIYDNKTAEGRRKNRRIDIAVQESDLNIIPPEAWEKAQEIKKPDPFIFKDFHFDLGSPEEKHIVRGIL